MTRRTVQVQPETTYFADLTDMAAAFGMAVVHRPHHNPTIECPCGFTAPFGAKGKAHRAIYGHGTTCAAAKANRPPVVELPLPDMEIAQTITVTDLAEVMAMSDADIQAYAERLAALDDVTVQDVMDQLLGELGIAHGFEIHKQAS